VETALKFFKKSQNCLFVEEETYKWATPKNNVNRRLIYLSLLFVVLGLLFSTIS